MIEYADMVAFVKRFAGSGIPLLEDVANLWDGMLGEQLSEDDLIIQGEYVARSTRVSLADVFTLAGLMEDTSGH